jgi:integrase
VDRRQHDTQAGRGHAPQSTEEGSREAIEGEEAGEASGGNAPREEGLMETRQTTPKKRKRVRMDGLYRRRFRVDGEMHVSPTWHYEFVYQNRRYRGCTGERDMQAAREFVQQERTRIQNKVRFGIAPAGEAEKALPTFAELGQHHLEVSGRMKRSIDDDRSILDRALVPALGKMRIGDITSADVERFRNARLAGELYDKTLNRTEKPSPQTVKNELACLRLVLNIAVKDGRLARNPVSGVKVDGYDNRRERVIAPDELGRLLMFVGMTKTRTGKLIRNEREDSAARGDHLRPMMILAYETGMRESEILGLKWSDVNTKTHLARLRRTKNGMARTVPLSERAERALQEWGQRHPEWVFPSQDGEGHLGLVSHAFRRLADRAEVAEVRFHDFRHTFCTRMVERGVDLITLKEITGHKTLAMLDRYSHPSDARKVALVRGVVGDFVGTQEASTGA